MFKNERMIRDLVEEFDGKIVGVQHGKHVKLKAAFGGAVVDLVIPNTPSDRRSLKNNRAYLKRRIEEERGLRPKPGFTPRGVTTFDKQA